MPRHTQSVKPVSGVVVLAALTGSLGFGFWANTHVVVLLMDVKLELSGFCEDLNEPSPKKATQKQSCHLRTRCMWRCPPQHPPWRLPARAFLQYVVLTYGGSPGVIGLL